jgi:hypothetical protein
VGKYPGAGWCFSILKLDNDDWILNADCILKYYRVNFLSMTQRQKYVFSIGVHIFKNVVFSDSYYMRRIKCLCVALYAKIKNTTRWLLICLLGMKSIYS